jgi:nitrite reductase/ring-hydroxylating ferredoxin subunit
MSPNDNGSSRWVRAASLSEIPEGGSRVVSLDGHVIALFTAEGRIFAVDNRCPHMGFPLDRGTISDCILTCHWHHARFDLSSGGTFDQWADDVRVYPVRTLDGEILIDLAERASLHNHRLERLRDGLARDIPLLIGKSVVALMDGAGNANEPQPTVEALAASENCPTLAHQSRDEGVAAHAGSVKELFRAGLEYGVRYRRDGWGAGLTTLTCMMNLLPALAPEDRPRAMYHGLAAVAEDTSGNPPHLPLRPLPGSTVDWATLARWLRRFVEVRDTEGAERCIVSAVEAGCPPRTLADMLFAAATDRRYLSIGHVVDFTNKAFEALDHAGWDLAGPVLASLARGYATSDRMEESNSWRSPLDLVAILGRAFEALPAALECRRQADWRDDRGELVMVILGDDPNAIADAMLAALRAGCGAGELAGAVAYAAALRIARFPISNEFNDWDTAHHSFTFANAVHQALRRAPSLELLRAAFDAAMSVYLNRFLNLPAVKLPRTTGNSQHDAAVCEQLLTLLDRQQQVNQTGELAAAYLFSGGDAAVFEAALGHALLREDRDFHTIQNVEAAFRQYSRLSSIAAGVHCLLAAARYLAAHSPTMRAQGQTYQIALKLHRGDRLFEDE